MPPAENLRRPHSCETEAGAEQTSVQEWLKRVRRQPPTSVDELPEIIIRRHRDAE